jgi:hypothetical protein
VAAGRLPATQYKKGKSGVRLVWKQNKSLMPMFIEPCCADEEYEEVPHESLLQFCA